MKWKRDPNEANRERKLEIAIENCFMLARRKRCTRYTYDKDNNPIANGPKSDDSDWDHIIRFCRDAGVAESVIRAEMVKK